MFRPYSIIVSLIILLFSAPVSYGQDTDWDNALDRYEFICSRSARWREMMAANQAVPRDSLVAMMGELNALKERIMWKRSDMTPGQRRRYEAIRDKYFPSQKTAGADTLRQIEGLLIPEILTVESQTEVLSGNRKDNGRTRNTIHLLAGVSAGLAPDFSIGGIAGITLDRFTLFAVVRSNFIPAVSDYDCLSDGTTSDGYIWSGGESKSSRLQLDLNLSYRFMKRLSAYAGCGYGRKTLLWKDSAGDWARVSDLSFSGFSADAGIILSPFTYGKCRGLSVIAGTTFVTGGYFDFQAGLAWEF